ncbi:DUF202 domain-containing protein [Streptomyces sp. PKU-EA00015]|uniref:DUF202 domain-containing protein n=1 Tax=Streptomyces sp. PKU-EA00015 TaxID=2748326 RepID=UPI0015A041DF|nr:DUF202 domain-containing protein [Streptomyces sp. PKU-EA00015]NWF28569.1 DUF202 domain-containing protein [Streptomyces sp. PKU-EA00015]
MTAPERDPGLQPERTRLAWRRTTLACTVVAVLAARQASGDAWPAVGLSLAAWLGFLAVAHRRIGAMDAARPPTLSLRGAVAAVGCVLALAAFAVAVVT